MLPGFTPEKSCGANGEGWWRLRSWDSIALLAAICSSCRQSGAAGAVIAFAAGSRSGVAIAAADFAGAAVGRFGLGGCAACAIVGGCDVSWRVVSFGGRKKAAAAGVSCLPAGATGLR